MQIGNARLPVFVSYAHEDNEGPSPDGRWLDRLLQILAPLRIQNWVCAWSDQDMRAGHDWQQEIGVQLSIYAEAAVLLVSPAFLASEFIRNSELPVLLKRAQDRGLEVIPVILRHCFFREALFKYPDPIEGPESVSLSVFQAINSPDEPLDALSRSEQDRILMKVGVQLLEIHRSRRAQGTSQFNF